MKAENFLPITKEEVEKRALKKESDHSLELDVIIVSGDAYVDHPSFGAAVIGRTLEAAGFSVAILPQPNWQDDLRDFKKFGKPRLFFGVTAGAMDSMVNHYTALKRKRSDDAYTPGGKSGFRPDYPSVVYTKILKQLYPETPVVLGGIEASLRRFAHYDYWQEKVLPSILVQSGADILAYGMGEKAIVEIASVFSRKILKDYSYENCNLIDLTHIRQIAYYSDKIPEKSPHIFLPSYADCCCDKQKFAEAFKIIEIESNKMLSDTILIQPSLASSPTTMSVTLSVASPTTLPTTTIAQQYIIANPPYPPQTQEEIDASFDLPYTRLPHPKYKKRGEIPAYTMIKHSVNIHRGCFGGCSFCTISAHQGKQICSRSEKSIIKEIGKITQMEDFKGYLSDVGGPSANMYKMQGKNIEICIKCTKSSCLFPQMCNNLNANHEPLLNLYHQIEKIPQIKKFFITSGIRYDLFTTSARPQPAMQYDNNALKYAEYVIAHCVSGRLKVAPEHTEQHILDLVRKPPYNQFLQFKDFFDKINRKHNLRQQLIPYFISSLPDCEQKDMTALKSKINKIGYNPEQVQSFTPTPMTLASTIYYTGIDPYTGKKIFSEKDIARKRKQFELFFNL
ncbi:UPF0313 protein [Bacteroidia bacterium]|nr:UPF0313 protein [Bacteroidia bacterium]